MDTREPPIRCVTDFDDSTRSIQEWNRQYNQLPQAMNPNTTSDQKSAQVRTDSNVTCDLPGSLNPGNESRLKDPPPQSSIPNPGGSPDQPPDISRQHKTPARGNLSSSGISPPEDQDAKISPPDFFEQEGPYHPSPVPAGLSKPDFVPPMNDDPLNIGIPGPNPDSSLEAYWSAGHQWHRCHGTGGAQSTTNLSTRQTSAPHGHTPNVTYGHQPTPLLGRLDRYS